MQIIGANINIVDELPEKIKLWREENVRMLEEKDKHEKTAIEQLRSQGSSELEEWYNNMNKSLDKVKEINRENQSIEVENDKKMTDGQIWESISNLCDFSHSKITKNRDVSRYNHVILIFKIFSFL
jgi:Clathrin light chain